MGESQLSSSTTREGRLLPLSIAVMEGVDVEVEADGEDDWIRSDGYEGESWNCGGLGAAAGLVLPARRVSTLSRWLTIPKMIATISPAMPMALVTARALLLSFSSATAHHPQPGHASTHDASDSTAWNYWSLIPSACVGARPESGSHRRQPMDRQGEVVAPRLRRIRTARPATEPHQPMSMHRVPRQPHRYGHHCLRRSLAER